MAENRSQGQYDFFSSLDPSKKEDKQEPLTISVESEPERRSRELSEETDRERFGNYFIKLDELKEDGPEYPEYLEIMKDFEKLFLTDEAKKLALTALRAGKAKTALEAFQFLQAEQFKEDHERRKKS